MGPDVEKYGEYPAPQGREASAVGALVMPRFTLHYNIVNSSKWIGTGWEFFDDETIAQQVYEAKIKEGHCPTLRPFHRERDTKHLGAVHRMIW